MNKIQKWIYKTFIQERMVGQPPETLDQMTYDSVIVPQDCPEKIEFYTVPRGANAKYGISPFGPPEPDDIEDDPNTIPIMYKTYVHTNIDIAKVLPSKSLKIKGLKISTTLVGAELSEFIHNSTFHFRIIDKDMWYVPLSLMCRQDGLLFLNLNHPINMYPYENFSVTLHIAPNYNPAKEFILMLGLDTDMKRPT